MLYKIAIVGGSIVGCMLAQLLRKYPGIELHIFERSPSSLSSRGTGIALPISLITTINQLIVDKPCPFYQINERTFYVKDSHGGMQKIWQQDASLAIVNWAQLYESLRYGLDDIYHAGCEVKNIEHAEGVLPVIELENGERQPFDLVICADGYHSFGRKLLFPEFDLTYAGYIAWRGTIPMSDITTNPGWEFYCFTEGHAIAISIPGESGDIRNWLFYTKMSPKELATFMSIQKPSQPLTDSAKTTLQYLAKKHLPGCICDMLKKTKNSFYQVIYDGIAPSVSKDNIILIGDAAKVLRPHIGSGATEGLRQAIELARVITSSANVKELHDALSKWTISEDIQSKKMLNLAQCVGDALVTHSPDWAHMNQALMDEWWGTVIKGQTWYVVDNTKSSTDTMTPGPGPRSRL